MRSLAALAVCACCAAIVSAQPETPVNPQLDKLLRWFHDVQFHATGYADPPANEVGTWTRFDLDTVVSDVKRIAAFLQRARENRLSPTATLQLYDRRFSREELEKLFSGNSTLIRGAVLHADVAVFVNYDATSIAATANGPTTFLVEDGRRKGGVRRPTAHWEIGRTILDLIVPSPGVDRGALLWYQAVSAFLLRWGYLDEAVKHSGKSLTVFPNDPILVLDRGYLHNKFSSADIQAAVQDVIAIGGRVAVDSRRIELTRAERYFRRAVVLDPSRADARIRLGDVLGRLERHSEAADELRRAMQANLSGPDMYFAELFLGREEHALGRREEARRHYENAAELYPKAQSPRLALSELARQAGDRNTALQVLRPLSAGSVALGRQTDPWWQYYEVHSDDAEPLMAAMRKLADDEPQ